MKKTTKKMIVLLVAVAALLSMAACGGEAGKKDASVMQGIFDKLTANADYAEWKSSFSATTFEEKLDGDSIVCSATGEEGMNGTFTFTLDGDYIVNTTDEGDYSAYAIMMYLKEAVADYYGMNNMLMTGYIAGLESAGLENKYFYTESADGKSTTRLYAAGEWKMEGLDEMNVDEKGLEYCDVLGENPNSFYINAGRITAASIGSADDLDLMVGEYGENTEKTLNAILAIVRKQQPNGHETFEKEFTELKETSGDGYVVYFGIPEEVAVNHEYKAAEGYSYVTVVFSADAETAGGDDGQNPVMNFAGTYQSGRCSLTITPGGKDGATITATWGNSADCASKWIMHAVFDPDTLRLTYADSTKTTSTYDENGNVVSQTVDYTDGFGRLQLFGDGTLRWEDENEADSLVGMTFSAN